MFFFEPRIDNKQIFIKLIFELLIFVPFNNKSGLLQLQIIHLNRVFSTNLAYLQEM